MVWIIFLSIFITLAATNGRSNTTNSSRLLLAYHGYKQYHPHHKAVIHRKPHYSANALAVALASYYNMDDEEMNPWDGFRLKSWWAKKTDAKKEETEKLKADVLFIQEQFEKMFSSERKTIVEAKFEAWKDSTWKSSFFAKHREAMQAVEYGLDLGVNLFMGGDLILGTIETITADQLSRAYGWTKTPAGHGVSAMEDLGPGMTSPSDEDIIKDAIRRDEVKIFWEKIAKPVFEGTTTGMAAGAKTGAIAGAIGGGMIFIWCPPIAVVAAGAGAIGGAFTGAISGGVVGAFWTTAKGVVKSVHAIQRMRTKKSILTKAAMDYEFDMYKFEILPLEYQQKLIFMLDTLHKREILKAAEMWAKHDADTVRKEVESTVHKMEKDGKYSEAETVLLIDQVFYPSDPRISKAPCHYDSEWISMPKPAHHVHYSADELEAIVDKAFGAKADVEREKNRVRQLEEIADMCRELSKELAIPLVLKAPPIIYSTTTATILFDPAGTETKASACEARGVPMASAKGKIEYFDRLYLDPFKDEMSELEEELSELNERLIRLEHTSRRRKRRRSTKYI